MQINCFSNDSCSKLRYLKTCYAQTPRSCFASCKQRVRERGIKIRRSINTQCAQYIPQTWAFTHKHTREYIFHRIQSAANTLYFQSTEPQNIATSSQTAGCKHKHKLRQARRETNSVAQTFSLFNTNLQSLIAIRNRARCTW